MVKKCIICNKEFNVSPSIYNIRKSCSRECQRKSMIGHVVSDETRKRISKAKIGIFIHKRNIKHSEETKFKLRMANIGKHNSPNTEFKKGNRGSKAGNWKGGKRYFRGYVFIHCINHPFKSKNNYVAEHRLVMEKKIGRFLKPEERVHHINEIKDDNRIENLLYFSCEAEHQKFHNSYFNHK